MSMPCEDNVLKIRWRRMAECGLPAVHETVLVYHADTETVGVGYRNEGGDWCSVCCPGKKLAHVTHWASGLLAPLE